jgi:hypothetical protein
MKATNLEQVGSTGDGRIEEVAGRDVEGKLTEPAGNRRSGQKIP